MIQFLIPVDPLIVLVRDKYIYICQQTFGIKGALATPDKKRPILCILLFTWADLLSQAFHPDPDSDGCFPWQDVHIPMSEKNRKFCSPFTQGQFYRLPARLPAAIIPPFSTWSDCLTQYIKVEQHG